MAGKSMEFGGSVEGSSIELISHESPESLKLVHAKSTTRQGAHKPSISQPSGHGIGHIQKKNEKKSAIALVDEAKISENVRAKLGFKYAFGSSSATMFDSLCTFTANVGKETSTVQSLGEKDNHDRVVYRVGKQLCVLDPDTGNQQFFAGHKNRTTENVIHFCISPNHKYISVCEAVNRTDLREDGGPATAQLSVYSLSTLNKVKMLSHPSGADFICSTFCGDMKFIAALTGEQDPQIVVWNWEKEKIHKVLPITVPATKIRAAPSNILLLTTTGPGMIKCWFNGQDDTLRPGAILPPAKETDAFVDHAWLSQVLGGPTYKMVALTDPEALNAQHPAAAVAAAAGGSLAGSDGNVVGGGSIVSGMASQSTMTPMAAKRQAVLIFEGSDVPGAGVTSVTAPIALELKQTISLRMEPMALLSAQQSTFGASVVGMLNAFSPRATTSSPETIGGGGGGSGAGGSTAAASAPPMSKACALVPTSKGFILVSTGSVTAYERLDDKRMREPYVESRRVGMGTQRLHYATTFPGEERLVLITKQNRMLMLPLENHGPRLNQLDDTAQAEMAMRRNSLSFAAGLVKDAGDASAAVDLPHGGHHLLQIVAMDVAVERSVLVTVSADRTARLWNYETLKCEVTHNFRTDEVLSVAIHASGFKLLVGFKDRVRLYNVLMDKLKLHRETIQKQCRELRFSNGSQYWAGASAMTLVVYDTVTFTQLMAFQGHMMAIKRLVWAPGDQALFSAGLDGNVYGWPIAVDARLDVLSTNNRQFAIMGMVVDTASTSFPKPADQREAIAAASTKGDLVAATSGPGQRPPPTLLELETRKNVVVSLVDGNIKICPWTFDLKDSRGVHTSLDIPPTLVPGDPSRAITAMFISASRDFLYAGTANGAIRIYPWPLINCEDFLGGSEGRERSPPPTAVMTSGGKMAMPVVHGMYSEMHVHASAVVGIKESPNGSSLITVGEDGSVFVFNVSKSVDPVAEREKEKEAKTKSSSIGNTDEMSATDILERTSALLSPSFGGTGSMGEGESLFNHEVLMLAIEEVEEHIREVVEMQKTLNDTNAKAEFHAHHLEMEHAEAMRGLMEGHDKDMKAEKQKLDVLKVEFDRRVREMSGVIEAKDIERVKMVSELENRYEHKLAEQLDRYDKLSEEMEVLKHKCKGLLSVEREEFTKQLNEVKNEGRTREKRLHMENRRLIDEKASEEASFKEVLGQQEEEYEDELKQLIAAAENELVNERETITKLRTLVQMKNTKVDQLKKKLLELSNMFKNRQAVLDQERVEKQKLQDTIAHYKKNLKEREDALSEKEKVILELRNTTRTLENFRFVLDHRLQQLSAEREPIRSHIEGLENHITIMYEELVDEFENKKESADVLELKDQKINIITQELKKLRQEVAAKDIYVTGFKRELGNIVSSMTVGKELEESVRSMYKKYVRGEKQKAGTANKLATDKIGDLLKQKEDPDDDPKSPVRNRRGSASAVTFAGVSGAAGANPQAAIAPAGGDGNFLSTSSMVREIEEALVEQAREATRHKQFVEKEATGLKHRLEANRDSVEREARNRLKENSSLLFECNNLRKEVKDLERKLDISFGEKQDLLRVIDRLKKQVDFDGGAGAGAGTTGAAPAERVMSSGPREMYYPSAPSPVSTAGASKPGTAQSAGLFMIDEGAGAGVGSMQSLSQPVVLPSVHVAAAQPPPYIASDASLASTQMGANANTNTNKATYALNSSLGPLGAQHRAAAAIVGAGPSNPRLHSGADGDGEISLAGRPLMPVREGEDVPVSGFEGGGDLEQNGYPGMAMAMPVPGRSNSPKGARKALHKSMAAAGAGAGAVTSSWSATGSVPRDLGHKNLVRKYERLAGDVTVLQSQLDEAHREREMQRLEISRLRKLLMQQSGQGMSSVPPLMGSIGANVNVNVNGAPQAQHVLTYGSGFKHQKGPSGAVQVGHYMHGMNSSVFSSASGNSDGQEQVGWVDGYFQQQDAHGSAGAGDGAGKDDFSLSGSKVNKHSHSSHGHKKAQAKSKLATSSVSVDLSLAPVEGEKQA